VYRPLRGYKFPEGMQAKVVATGVWLLSGGSLVCMALYDLVRAAIGCSGADWLEVLVRSVIVLSAVQQAVFLWWLRSIAVRR